MKNVLITGAGGPAGQALIAQLAGKYFDDEEIVLIGADMEPLDDPRLSIVARVPAATDPGYTPALQHLSGVVRANLIIPTVSEELPIVAAIASLLGADPSQSGGLDNLWSNVSHITPWMPPPVAVSPPGPVAIAADKLHTMWALDRGGASVPSYSPAEAFKSTYDALEAFGGPLIVKPRVSRGGRGVQVVDASDQLDWQQLPAGTIAQSFAPGVEYNPQVYRSWETGETTVIVLEKTGLREGRVGNAIGVRRCAPGEVPDVEHLARRAVAAVELCGPIDLDIRRNEDGMPVVLEVNARFGANSESAPEVLELLLGEAFGHDGLAESRAHGW